MIKEKIAILTIEKQYLIYILVNDSNLEQKIISSYLADINALDSRISMLKYING